MRQRVPGLPAMRRAVAATAWLAALLGTTARAQEARGSAGGTEAAPYRAALQIVLDASALMGQPAPGHVEPADGAGTRVGRTLFDSSLAAVRRALEKAGPRQRGLEASLRLMGGSEPAGADRCRASLPLVPPGASPGPVLDAHAARLRPKGARPLAAALIAAANDLPRTPGTLRSVVLVTAGGDGCGRDPCATVDELRRTHGLGALTILGVGPEAALDARLRCLGAPVEPAETEAELERRLVSALDAAFVPAELVVNAAADGRPLPARVEVFTSGDREPVVRARTGDVIRLAGGNYDVRAHRPGDADGASTDGWRRGIELAAASRIALRVALGSAPGTILVRVRLNGEPAPEGTRVLLFAPGVRDDYLEAGWPDEPLTAPRGTYDVAAEIPASVLSPVTVWKPSVELQSGATVQLTLDAVQKVGRVQPVVVSAEAVVDDAVVFVLPNGSRSETNHALSPGEEASLPVGSYTFGARLETVGGPLLAWHDGVQVRDGERTQVKLDLGPTGFLQVRVAGHGESDGFIAGIVPRGQATPVGWLQAFASERVPAGRYDLRMEQPGFVPRLWWHRDVEVGPGERKVISTKPPF